VTGGAGFIGSAVCRHLIKETGTEIVYVEDHAKALYLILLQVVQGICTALDELSPNGRPHDRHITYVTDRPGHDHRYAIDASKLERELGWRAEETFTSGLAKTVQWYLANDWWWSPLREKVYAGERIGLVNVG